MSVKRGIYVAPFEGLADPLVLAELARSAEDHGWDGFFVWDHVPTAPRPGPWPTRGSRSALRHRDRAAQLGPMVTPLSRRRVQKLARETVTLDQLSRGRLVLGVGLGSAGTASWSRSARSSIHVHERARSSTTAWSGSATLAGEFEPVPVQRPRIPVWVAGRWPNRVRFGEPRAGTACSRSTWPDRRPWPRLPPRSPASGRARGPFDLVVDNPPGEDPSPGEAGATWCLVGFGSSPGRPRSGR